MKLALAISLLSINWRGKSMSLAVSPRSCAKEKRSGRAGALPNSHDERKMLSKIWCISMHFVMGFVCHFPKIHSMPMHWHVSPWILNILVRP